MEFAENFRIAYSPIIRNNLTTKATEEHFNLDPSRYDHHLHQKSTEIFSCATSLVEQLRKSYERLEVQQTSFTVDTDWQEDLHQMKHILDVGRRIGEQKVESILTGAGKPLLDVTSAEISQLLYDKHSRLADDLPWEGAVRRQEKAVMRLVNTLPLD
jgi:hypothetical protein